MITFPLLKVCVAQTPIQFNMNPIMFLIFPGYLNFILIKSFLGTMLQNLSQLCCSCIKVSVNECIWYTNVLGSLLMVSVFVLSGGDSLSRSWRKDLTKSSYFKKTQCLPQPNHSVNLSRSVTFTFCMELNFDTIKSMLLKYKFVLLVLSNGILMEKEYTN